MRKTPDPYKLRATERSGTGAPPGGGVVAGGVTSDDEWWTSVGAGGAMVAWLTSGGTRRRSPFAARMAFRLTLPCVAANADLFAGFDAVAAVADADDLLGVGDGCAPAAAGCESAGVVEFVDGAGAVVVLQSACLVALADSLFDLGRDVSAAAAFPWHRSLAFQ
jgi:hypothetical protein